MPDFKTILNLWPDNASLAADLGVKVTSVRQMKWRNSVSPQRWVALVRAAEARGIPGVTYETLEKAANTEQAA